MTTGLKIFYFFFRPIQRLPLSYHRFWGRVFAWVCGDLLHYRRDDIMINLARSFPDLKYKELIPLAKQYYSHMGDLFAETIWFGGCFRNPEKLHDSHICEIENPQIVFDAFRRRNVMILNSHFGNWELVGGLFQYIYNNMTPEEVGCDYHDVTVIYKKLSSSFFDSFMQYNRTAPLPPDYDGYVENTRVVRYAVEHKDERRMYIFNTDQHPYKGVSYEEIPSFMHQRTKVMTGGAGLACKLKMAIFYMSIDRQEDGHYKIAFKTLAEDASTTTPVAIMEKFYEYLQVDVRNNPGNYLWSHRRWK